MIKHVISITFWQSPLLQSPCALCQSVSLTLVCLLKYSSRFPSSLNTIIFFQPHRTFHPSSRYLDFLLFFFFFLFCPFCLFFSIFSHNFTRWSSSHIRLQLILFITLSPLFPCCFFLFFFLMQPDFWFLLCAVYDSRTVCLPDSNIFRRCQENCKKCTASNICTECKPGMR